MSGISLSVGGLDYTCARDSPFCPSPSVWSKRGLNVICPMLDDPLIRIQSKLWFRSWLQPQVLGCSKSQNVDGFTSDSLKRLVFICENCEHLRFSYSYTMAGRRWTPWRSCATTVRCSTPGRVPSGCTRSCRRI